MTRILTIATSIVLLTSCSFYGARRSQSNYASTYDNNVGAISADYKVYHVADRTSQIIFRVHSSDLLYSRNDKSDAFHASFKVSYIVFDPEKDNYILDSNSTTVVDRDNDRSDKYILGRLNANIPGGHEYMVEVQVEDLNRNSSMKEVMITDKRTSMSGDNFLVTKKSTGNIHFNSYIDHSDPIIIESERNNEENAEVKLYAQSNKYPPPPFSKDRSKAPMLEIDSTFQLNRENGFEISLEKKGVYHFRTDTTIQKGLTLYRFEKGFPKVNSPQAMLYPLRYICTKDEFTKLEKAIDRRKAVEDFWVDLAGNKDRARRLIKIYYSRVEEANKKFTSYNPGWRTDRGLIYVIFGSPDIVRKYKRREVWVYGEEGNAMAISFTFDHVENQYSDNAYELKRNPMYKTTWYRAVETWRSGRSYSAK